MALTEGDAQFGARFFTLARNSVVVSGLTAAAGGGAGAAGRLRPAAGAAPADPRGALGGRAGLRAAGLGDRRRRADPGGPARQRAGAVAANHLRLADRAAAHRHASPRWCSPAWCAS